MGSATLASLETFGTEGKSTGVQFVSVPCSIIFSCDMPCNSEAARMALENMPRAASFTTHGMLSGKLKNYQLVLKFKNSTNTDYSPILSKCSQQAS